MYLHVCLVSACIDIVFACICMYKQEYLPGDTLKGCHWACETVRGAGRFCAAHISNSKIKIYFFRAPPPPTPGSQWARSWPTCWCRTGGCRTPDARRGRRCPLENRRPCEATCFLESCRSFPQGEGADGRGCARAEQCTQPWQCTQWHAFRVPVKWSKDFENKIKLHSQLEQH